MTSEQSRGRVRQDVGVTGPVAADAFRALTEPHRRELQLHCYRILGSVGDAEDAVQETLVAAWRGFEHFEGRAPVRAWLYRIATNRCLNALRAASRRPRRALPEPPFAPPRSTRWEEPAWLEPYPDALLGGVPDAAPGPAARYEMREAVELAFVAALQHLPARQRAVLVLRDVLGYAAPEVAEMLATSEAAVKSALQRARATVESRLHGQGREAPVAVEGTQESELARRFADAFAADDVPGVVALLTEDAWLTMPPYPHAYQGRAAIGAFLGASAAWRVGRRYALVLTRANAQPAFGCYLEDADAPVARAAGLIVLTVRADGLVGITRFMDPAVFRYFGLPPTTPAPR